MLPPRLAVPTLLTVAALALSACGDSGDERSAAAPAMPAQPPAASVEDFPPAEGKTLVELQQELPEGPILAPSVQLLLPERKNRVGFALFDTARKQLSGAQVALYTARPDGTGLKGPYVARSESLVVKPQFQSRQTAEDPDAARGVYVADVPFGARGKRVVAAVAKLDGRLVSTTAFEVEVGPKGATPPDVGEKAPSIDTETAADVGGDLSKIDTRIPPAKDLHLVNFADVVGKKPVVLTFATPQLCQTKVCGPVTDVVLQVKQQTKGDVAFVHQEIYRENSIAKGYRPQLAAYRLATEPWTFVIDGQGIVRARFEGALSVDELQRAVDRVL